MNLINRFHNISPSFTMNSTAHPSQESEAADEPASLWARLFNVFAAPGELFESLRESQPAHVNWLVPLLLSMASGVLFTVVVFSQPDIVAAMRAQQEAALMERVQAGRLSPEQAEQALAAMNRFTSPQMLMFLGSVGAIIGGAIFFVVVSLLTWLLTAKLLKGGTGLLKAFELAGLASMVYVVGSLLTMTLVLLKGDIQAGLNLALLIERFDPTNTAHQGLAALDAVTIWYLAVLSLGASQLTHRRFGAAAIWVFGSWAIVRGGLALGSAWWAGMQAGL
jgi:hypothetical protein